MKWHRIQRELQRRGFKYPLATAVILVLFAHYVLDGTAAFAQPETQQTLAGATKSCMMPGVPTQRVVEAVDASFALPASLGADAMIRVAVRVSPRCPILAKYLLERAFEQADSVRSESAYDKGGGTGLADSRISYSEHGYLLRVDRLSLQSRAIIALVPLNPKTAIQLFQRLSPPRPPAAVCSSPFVSDVSIYYEALEKALREIQTRKSRNDAEAHAPFTLLEQAVGATTSPVQLFPLSVVMERANLADADLSSLVNLLAANIESFPVDDRTLSAGRWHAGVGSPIEGVGMLVTLSRNRKVSPSSLVRAYRDYLDRSLKGPHCADNPPHDHEALSSTVKALNQRLAGFEPGIEPISVPASDPPAEPGPIEGGYWSSPKTKDLLIDAKRLNYDDNWRKYTDADRKTAEWRDRVRRMLNHLDDWKAADEQDPADYYHQRCSLLSGIVDQLPPGALYDWVISVWVTTFEESSLQWDSPAEWYFEVLRLLQRSSRQASKESIAPAILAAVRNSSNTYLRASGVLADFLQSGT